MRWIWIDRVLEYRAGDRLVAIKNVSMAEDHVHHADPREPALPASLIVEGMAQTAGILLSIETGFREKVILAKVGKVQLDADATPGCVIRHTATIAAKSSRGASLAGIVECSPPDKPGVFEPIGQIDLVMSFLEQNMAGVEYTSHNFVLNDLFETLLRTSGFELPDEQAQAELGRSLNS